ncbi:hypothetical protein BCR35DRAFT_354274 [Leucosporidium creatinivorum]|uniref:Uncharacterized protein n=1 Tax=Leucosporidium creatinivorum TaxID=106004 RepID=A0A1Y2EN32_9BASI|nr:hypothetical protein BCR35DRAFT_354274 [Leucosporidium creatinivorum]
MATALERARLYRERQAAQGQGSSAPAAPSAPLQPSYSVHSLPPTSTPLPPPNAQNSWPEFPSSSSLPQPPAPPGIAPAVTSASPSISPSPAPNSIQDLSSKLLNAQVALAGERSAQRQLKEEHSKVLEQKEREIDALKQQQQQQQQASGRSATGPLTMEKCISAPEALDTLQLGFKADDKTVVAKYESLMESHPHLGRLWKGALHAIALERTGSEILSQHLRQLNQDEIHAHFISAELPVTDGLLASGDPVITKEELAAEKARAAKVDTKLNATKRDLDSKISECATWRKKAEDLLESREQPSRKTVSGLLYLILSLLLNILSRGLIRLWGSDQQQVLQADLTRVTEERDVLKGEVEKSARSVEKLEKELVKFNERFKKWEEERKGLLDARKAAESEAERLKAGSQLEHHRRSPTPSTMSTASEGQQKFVINRLLAQVKQLNAELAQKSNENAELMMKLVEGGDE